MPNVLFDTLEAVPAPFRENAEEEGGKFKVNLVLNSKLEEFRDNNIEVSKERDALKADMAKISRAFGEDVELDDALEDLEALRVTAQRVKDGELVENEGLDSAIAKRTAKMKETYEAQLAESHKAVAAHKQRADTAESKFNRSIIDRAVTDAAIAENSGVNASAIPDIVRRASDIFSVNENGKLVAKDGDVIIYGDDGTSPLSPSEWIEGLKSEAPHYFKQSNGGGVGQGGDKNRGGYSAEEFNKLSPTQKLQVANGM